ncbi:hypothetical protein [Fischerella sp. PCC 9605]|nr:hypothetical protein [Fischerella sp. PCC 9605]
MRQLIIQVPRGNSKVDNSQVSAVAVILPLVNKFAIASPKQFKLIY